VIVAQFTAASRRLVKRKPTGMPTRKQTLISTSSRGRTLPVTQDCTAPLLAPVNSANAFVFPDANRSMQMRKFLLNLVFDSLPAVLHRASSSPVVLATYNS
jgi:hypothetical protein